MRKLMATVLLAAVTLLPLAPAGAAKSNLKQLGTDPAGDGLPALDITYLQVGRTGANLEIRIGLDKMLPRSGSYPLLPGIEWVFDVKDRTFIAEAVAGTGAPRFYLFEQKGDSYEQLESPTGTFDPADGYTSILVPLKTIGARTGVKISGADGLEHGDVDAHVHVGPQTVYPDGMETEKDFVVP